MNDERIIGLFFERSEQAISELEKKYGKLLYAVSNNVLNDSEDARECDRLREACHLDATYYGEVGGDEAFGFGRCDVCRQKAASDLLAEFLNSLCEEVIVLHHGEKIAEGTPGQVMNDPYVMEVYLGTKGGAAHA